ncbi:MAG TPA: tetratricopeptide repeat protein [Burkholderiales bacterium]|nr:tetratricopeptide repeat protein [Burkholderiales bacterium]
MPATDHRGCAISGATGHALELYEAALEALRLQAGDALGLARRAAREAPEFVAAHQLEAALLLSSRDVRDFESAGWVYARMATLRMNERERGHAAALAAAVDGDFAAATRRYDDVLDAAPRDAVALHVASVMDYYLGSPATMRERSTRALRSWDASLPGFHGLLAIHAFALEECGEYGAAEAAARQALELEPRDLRAHHAMTHVFEMQGRAEEGIRWMGMRARHWTQGEAISTHLWWHLALHHQQAGRPRFALEIYDRRMRGGDALSERIDASALLWRLMLDGVETGRRFESLAGAWASHAEDAFCAFNDLHAMMAFAGGGRWDLAHRLLSAQIRRVARQVPGANRDMTRLVGLPACRALLLFARGEYAAAEALLRALPPVAHHIGGSHAQRDVLHLTRAAAVQRSYRRAA